MGLVFTMTQRKTFHLTEAQYKKLAETPPNDTNHEWEKLGDELGFRYLTIRPSISLGTRYFTAEILEEDA